MKWIDGYRELIDESHPLAPLLYRLRGKQYIADVEGFEANRLTAEMTGFPFHFWNPKYYCFYGKALVMFLNVRFNMEEDHFTQDLKLLHMLGMLEKMGGSRRSYPCTITDHTGILNLHIYGSQWLLKLKREGLEDGSRYYCVTTIYDQSNDELGLISFDKSWPQRRRTEIIEVPAGLRLLPNFT